MKNIKLVVTDLDGTLLTSEKKISAFTLAVREHLKEKGILFAIATARSANSIEKKFPELKIDAGIFQNGAVIKTSSKEVRKIGIERGPELAQRILKDIPDSNIAIESKEVLYANFDIRSIWKDTEYIETKDFKEIDGEMSEKIVIGVETEEEIENLKKYMSDDLLMQSSVDPIVVIMNSNAGKANGIKKLAESLNVTPEQIVAFGDEYNDIDMLEYCGIGVAMGNAVQSVKMIADEICETNDEDGVAKWIQDFLGTSLAV